jgi:hypothetical protein
MKRTHSGVERAQKRAQSARPFVTAVRDPFGMVKAVVGS